MDSQIGNKHVVMMAFGLPLMTTVIVVCSMYAGHVLTTRSDRPTNVNVMAQTPKIDVNVPQGPAPTVQVAAATPQVSVNLPQLAPPQITVNPAAPTVTVIERRDGQQLRRDEKESRPALESTKSATVAAPATEPSNTAIADTFELPARTEKRDAAKTESLAQAAQSSSHIAAAGPVIVESKRPVAPHASMHAPAGQKSAATAASTPHSDDTTLTVPDEPTLDTLYQFATCYIEKYCRKNGLDPATENAKWTRRWQAGLEQALADNIDTSEQTYINRMVIAKRDYFNVEKTTPERVVEACRLLLRYRDAQLTWLSAMKEAMTNENLRKTVAFLSVGP